MAIDLVEKFLPYVDEQFSTESNRELTEWERMVQERQRPARSDPPRSQRSVREQLRRLQVEGRRQQPRRKVVDRDSRCQTEGGYGILPWPPPVLSFAKKVLTFRL